MLGAVMIGTLEQSLFRLQISEFWRDALLGLLILLAVASDAVILQRLRALWARADLKLIAEAAGRPTPAKERRRDDARSAASRAGKGCCSPSSIADRRHERPALALSISASATS